MILVIESLKGNILKFPISSEEDLTEVFNMFPQTKFIFKHGKDLEDSVNKISTYINSHSLHCWVENQNDEIIKSLKSKAALAGIAISSLLPTASTAQDVNLSLPKQSVSTPAKTTRQPAFGANPEDKFLWTIREIESSGGKNINHKKVTHGHLKGYTAMGNWALMPTTVQEIVNRMKLKNTATDADKKLLQMKPNELKNYIEKNPAHELRLARFLARHVLNRHSGDMHRAAYSWLYGQNLKTQAITADKLNDDYVTKFKKFHTKNPYVQKQTLKLPATTTFTLTKGETEFKQKVKKWQKYREELDNTITVTSSYNPDPGRLREKELDEKTADKKTGMEHLKNLFKV